MPRAARVAIAIAFASGCYGSHSLDDEPGSGRLRRLQFVAPGGASVFAGFRDTELGLDCQFRQYDGVLRCLPELGFAIRTFVDDECTQVAQRISESQASCEPQRFIASSGCEGLTVFEAAGQREVEVYYRGSRDDDTCERVEEPTRVVLYERVEPEAFATAAVEQSAGPFGRDTWITEDGQRVPGAPRRQGEPCRVYQDGEDALCAAVTGNALRHVNACGIFATPNTCDFEQSPQDGDLFVVLNTSCLEVTSEIREVGALSERGPECIPSTGPVYESRPADPSRLFPLELRMEGEGRIRTLSYGWPGAGDAERFRARFWDTELGTICRPAMVGGQLRCMPATRPGLAGGVPTTHSDAECELYAVVDTWPVCDGDRVTLNSGACGDIDAVYAVGPPTTRWFRQEGGACVPGDPSQEVRPWTPLPLAPLERRLLP